MAVVHALSPCLSGSIAALVVWIDHSIHTYVSPDLSDSVRHNVVRAIHKRALLLRQSTQDRACVLLRTLTWIDV